MRYSFPYVVADHLVPEDPTISAATITRSRFGLHIKFIFIWVLEIRSGARCGTRLRRWWGLTIVDSSGTFHTLAQRRSFLMCCVNRSVRKAWSGKEALYHRIVAGEFEGGAFGVLLLVGLVHGDVSQMWWRRSAQKVDGIPSSFDDRGGRIARDCGNFMSAHLVLKIL